MRADAKQREAEEQRRKAEQRRQCLLYEEQRRVEEKQRELDEQRRKAEQRRHIVIETSSCLKELYSLNKRYNFHTDIRSSYSFDICLESLAQFNRYNLQDLFDANIDYLYDIFTRCNANRDLYVRYLFDVDRISRTVAGLCSDICGVPTQVYIDIENAFFIDLLVNPVVDCEVECVKSYVTPGGRNSYRDSQCFGIDFVQERRSFLIEKLAYERSEEARRKRARSQMSDKLRYEILKRDGFRCRLCGRTADDGVKLHVDHIIPVAKGGETVPDNLRTLCEDCNWGKGDSLE